MIVVDASAIIAILSSEPEAGVLIVALERAEGAATSPIAVYEAALGLCRKRHSSASEAEADVVEFLALAHVRVAEIEPGAAHGASTLSPGTARGCSTPRS